MNVRKDNICFELKKKFKTSAGEDRTAMRIASWERYLISSQFLGAEGWKIWENLGKLFKLGKHIQNIALIPKCEAIWEKWPKIELNYLQSSCPK